MSDYYEVKINLGTDWKGNKIRKSFYSKKSKADARRKAEKYRAQYEFNLLCGGDEARKRVFFRDWAIQSLESSKKPFVCDETVFVDVPEDAFFYNPVMWAVENGITAGTTPTTFDPNGQCMRAVVVTFLWRNMAE